MILFESTPWLSTFEDFQSDFIFLLNVSQINVENVFVVAFGAYVLTRQYVHLLLFAPRFTVEGTVGYVHML